MNDEITYVVYSGEKVLAMGSIDECAARLGVKPDSIRWYASQAAHRRRGGSGVVAYRYHDYELIQPDTGGEDET